MKISNNHTYNSMRQLLTAFTLLILPLALTSTAFADGTEQLNPTSLPLTGGSGIVSNGVGLEDTGNGAMALEIPSGSVATQTVLYWVGRNLPITPGFNPAPATDTIQVNGVDVIGNLIGGDGDAYNGLVYRADITAAFPYVGTTLNLALDGFDFPRNNGAAAFTTYIDVAGSLIDVFDGRDYAWLPDPIADRQVTAPVTHTFTPETSDVEAELTLFVADIGFQDSGEIRPSFIAVTVDEVTTFHDVLGASLGHAMDVVVLPVTIPAGVMEVTAQVFSGEIIGEDEDGLILGGNNPSSLIWFASALSISNEECLPCEGKIVDLVLEYTGDATVTSIEVITKMGPKRGALDIDLGSLPYIGISGNSPELDSLNLNNGFADTLGTEIYIFVNGEIVSQFHTSCSVPIGAGSYSGPFTVVSGSSKSGPLCADYLSYEHEVTYKEPKQKSLNERKAKGKR